MLIRKQHDLNLAAYLDRIAALFSYSYSLGVYMQGTPPNYREKISNIFPKHSGALMQ